MAGMIAQQGPMPGGPPPAAGGMPTPQAPPGPAPAGGEGNPDKVQAMLILQPVRLLYDEQHATAIVEAAKSADPAKVLAAAAVAAVTASAKAGQGKGAQMTEDQLGNAVVEVIKAAGALLVAGGVVPPDQIPQTINSAIELASQGGAGGESGQPPRAAEAAPPGPGGAMPPGMAGSQPMPAGV